MSVEYAGFDPVNIVVSYSVTGGTSKEEVISVLVDEANRMGITTAATHNHDDFVIAPGQDKMALLIKYVPNLLDRIWDDVAAVGQQATVNYWERLGYDITDFLPGKD